MSYFYNLFVSVDQFGNALAFGNPDNTISARIGYFNENPDKIAVQTGRGYWKVLRAIVDTTFLPVDGKGHCKQAFYKSAGHKFENSKWKVIWLGLLSVLVVISCIPMAALLWTLGWIMRIFRPLKDERIPNMKINLEGAHSRLHGVHMELWDFYSSYDAYGDFELDQEMRDLSDKVILKAQKLRNDIN